MNAEDSSAVTHAGQDRDGGHGPKFLLDIEDQDYPWHSDTITPEDIITLAGWPAGTQVVEVDKDQRELTLQPGQTIQVKPGHGFGKKLKFKRG
jgi:hypothetical protein